MVKRLSAIAFIFVCTAIAWMILGATLVARTGESDVSQRDKLTAQWGSDQTQTAPDFSARFQSDKHNYQTIPLPVVASRIDVNLNLEQRRDGLLWYNLYNVRFTGKYRVRNDSRSPHVLAHFPFPSTDGTYADFAASIDGRPIADLSALNRGCVGFSLSPGREATLDVSYRSRGMGTWTYRFGSDVESVTDLVMTMSTNFAAIDFPPKTLLPTAEQSGKDGWHLEWRYATLVTGNGIGMAFPYPLQPGPLAQRITFWGPVALFFYLFVMLVITTLRKVDLHPVNYFFLAAAFFAFHLLFAYLVQPHSDRSRLRHLLGSHVIFDDHLLASGGRLALCGGRKRRGAAHLLDPVLVRAL